VIAPKKIKKPKMTQLEDSPTEKPKSPNKKNIKKEKRKKTSPTRLFKTVTNPDSRTVLLL